MEWFIKCVREYANFEGRASRTEYWMFVLFYSLFLAMAMIIDVVLFDGSADSAIFGPLTLIFTLLLAIPSIAAATRRLHDVGMSGWLLLVGIVPILGVLALFVFLLQKGDLEENKYGPVPNDSTSGGNVRSKHISRDVVKEDGTYEQYDRKGKLISRGMYINGKKEGVFTTYYDNGAVFTKIMYVEGKEDGLYQKFYNNGQIMLSIPYVNGLKEGKFETYYIDGKLYQSGTYRTGKIVGTYEEYSEKGELTVKKEIA